MTRIRRRVVRTRRIDFVYPTEDLPRHFMNDDLMMSHIVNVLSASFPRGEEFFVTSLRNYRDQIADPELKTQVAGFIGQEAVHRREHRTFNERLDALGYPASEIDQTIGRMFDFVERRLSKRAHLAMTAAFEHYTAVIGEALLRTPAAQAQFGVEEIRSLFLWHAMEETEHKAVAFDAFQEISGSYLLRVGTMHAITLVWGAYVIRSIRRSLRSDPASRDRRRLRRSLLALLRSPFATPTVAGHLLAYNRPGFHPDDRDASDLLEEWKQRLFAEGGPLVGRMRTAEAV
ncbi:MAG TPA: metal-dependent hydrolase [Acidimicrobiales bacterium]|jgi:hypothetical protein